ncbi:MAG: Flp pilus assembly complex ATPase component TadA, partial [Candidatus Riflebacteria bacterium]|nr:Flp pilus assembly complex ATPase component TadA [Candidatus Riflebacteria bacterium]
MDTGNPDTAHSQEGIRKELAKINPLEGRKDDQAFGALLDALNSPFWAVRKRAAELLAGIGEMAVQRIQEQFQALTDNQRHWSLTIVAWVVKAGALPWLKNAYAARSSAVRSSVIAAVSEIQGPEAVDLLMRALEDDSWLNRYAAAEALERRGEEVLEKLKQGFMEGRGDIKLWSLQLLVRIFGRGAANFLATCKSHEDPDIRHYGIRALGESDDEWAIRQLVEALADSHFINRRLASRTLVAKGKRSVTALVESLSGGNLDIIYWALQTLGKIGDEAMVKPIVLLVLSSHGDRAAEIREWAVDSLGELKTEASAKRLLEIATEFPDMRPKIGQMLQTFKARAVSILLKDALSPNADLKTFCRNTLDSMNLPGARTLLEDLEKRGKVEVDSLMKAIKSLAPLQLEEAFARPRLDVTQLTAFIPSLSATDVSSISRIAVGMSRDELTRLAAAARQKEGTTQPPRSGTRREIALGAEPAAQTYPVALDDILKKAINAGASDIHLKPGLPPIFRIRGVLGQTELPVLTPKDTQDLITASLAENLYKHLITRKELDAGYEIQGVSRFRLNCFSEMNGYGMVARVIPNRVPTLADLELPRVFRTFCNYIHGIILICGPTGSGKSTTLAAMIDYINETREEHVL